MFPNIRKSDLHNVATKKTLVHCSKVIGWIIYHIDVENRIVINEQGISITNFQPLELERYYNFCDPTIYMIIY
jgi:hypothetical protein